VCTPKCWGKINQRRGEEGKTDGKKWFRAGTVGNEQGATPTEKGAHTVTGEGGAPRAIAEKEAQAVEGGVPVVTGGAIVTMKAGGAATAAAAQAPVAIEAAAAVGGATAGGGVTDVVTADTADIVPRAATKVETTGVTAITVDDTVGTATAGIGATPEGTKQLNSLVLQF